MDRDVYAKLVSKLKTALDSINTTSEQITPLNTVRTQQLDLPTISAGGYADITATLDTPASFGFVVGFMVQANLNAVPLRVVFTDKSTISVRVRNVHTGETTGGNILVFFV